MRRLWQCPTTAAGGFRTCSCSGTLRRGPARRPSGLLLLPHPGRRALQVGTHDLDRLVDPFLGGRAHERAAAGADADLHQAVGLEDAQRLADGDATDAEVLAQLALGRQPVARLELALPHEHADLVDDDPGDAPRVDAVEQAGGRLATLGAAGAGAAGCAPGPLGARGLAQRARATHNGSLVSG